MSSATSFCDTFAHLYRPEDLEAFLSKFTLDAWTAELGDERFAFQVAEADGEIIGFVKLGPPELAGATDRYIAIELRQLYILQDWRGLGAAQALMDWALAEAKARGGQELYLTVYTENRRARRFYEKLRLRRGRPLQVHGRRAGRRGHHHAGEPVTRRGRPFRVLG